jgi:phosphate transport system permease protein
MKLVNRKRRTARRYFLDRLVRYSVYFLCGVAILPLFFIFGFIFSKGITILDWEFLTSLPKSIGESGGGVVNAITGSLYLVGIAASVAIPLGVAAGTYLSEYRGSKLANILGQAVDVLNGVPSIVIGLVVYELVVLPMGGFSAISGGIALGMIMIPVITRSTEETLKMLPKSLKEASLALGASYATTVLRVVLPAGLTGIITGILVSLARVAGETAPLLFTAFGNPFVNLDPLKPVSSLPALIFNYAVSPYEDWHRLAWGSACVLLLGILALNLFSRWLSRRYRWY